MLNDNDKVVGRTDLAKTTRTTGLLRDFLKVMRYRL